MSSLTNTNKKRKIHDVHSDSTHDNMVDIIFKLVQRLQTLEKTISDLVEAKNKPIPSEKISTTCSYIS